MANQIVHPEAEYKIAQVGPTRSWDFTGNDGNKVSMTTYSIQLEGVADWVDLNTAAGSDAPKIGDTLDGHIEDAGKFGLKFTKKRKSGNWGSKGGYSAGAAWSAAFQASATITTAYYAASATKPKSFDEFFGKVEAVANKVKTSVDTLAKTATATEGEVAKTESETGESPANPDEPIQLDTISEDALGKW